MLAPEIPKEVGITEVTIKKKKKKKNKKRKKSDQRGQESSKRIKSPAQPNPTQHNTTHHSPTQPGPDQSKSDKASPAQLSTTQPLSTPPKLCAPSLKVNYKDHTVETTDQYKHLASYKGPNHGKPPSKTKITMSKGYQLTTIAPLTSVHKVSYIICLNVCFSSI